MGLGAEFQSEGTFSVAELGGSLRSWWHHRREYLGGIIGGNTTVLDDIFYIHDQQNPFDFGYHQTFHVAPP